MSDERSNDDQKTIETNRLYCVDLYTHNDEEVLKKLNTPELKQPVLDLPTKCGRGEKRVCLTPRSPKNVRTSQTHARV